MGVVGGVELRHLGQAVERLLSGIDLGVARILDRALSDREITPEEGARLFGVQGAELLALMLAADELRRRKVGDIVTYVVVRNINFTNICYTGCSFCASAKHFEDPDAYFMDLGEIADRAEEAWRRGATEVCLQGGLHPRMSGYYYRDICVAIKERVPELHIHAFSPFEILYCSRRTGLSIEGVLRMLKEAGLGTIPGTAAEILDSEVRRVLTRNKLTAEQWVEIVRTAHRLGIRSTATIMYGHVDRPEHWARHIGLIRSIQKETGGFTEFVPLGFIHQNTRLYREGGARPGPTGMEDVKMHAVARLMLNGWIENIQVSWVKLGPKLAQVCLNAGANDFGGTLMDEIISKSAGATYGEYMPPEEFRRLIRDMGRIPAQRNTTYELLKVFDD
jgi:7,8-didemethyl-8-hydroxy-5-deazariboflavin synthase CofH subunit